MPGSSGGGVWTVPPGRPTPQQSMSGLDLEELAEIGTVCSLPAPSREETGGFLSGALCPILFFFFQRSICFESRLCWVFTAAPRLSLLAASRGHSSLGCVGRSLGWLLSCGAQA